MKKVYISVLLGLVIASSMALALEQSQLEKIWHDITQGIKDREFYAISENGTEDNAVYVGTTNGLHKKLIGGEKWEQVFACRGQSKGINDIYADKTGTVYIATRNGLYKSPDSGINWVRIFRGIAKENDCIRVVMDPQDEKKIYLGTGKGLFYSNDGGKVWKKFRRIANDSKIKSISIPRQSTTNYVYAICGNELYRVHKILGSAKKIFNSSSRHRPEEELADEGTLPEEGIFLLNDVTCKNGRLYLATNRGLFISSNEGSAWSRFNSEGLSNRFVNYILPLGANGTRMFAATKGGVFEYVEDEQKWKKIYAGMDSVNVKKLMKNKTEKNIWALCRNKIYRITHDDFCDSNESPLDTKQILSKFGHEPTINEVQRIAIDYAEVHPDKIARWRTKAKFKALLPRVNFGIDHAWSDTYEIYTASSKSYWVDGPQDRTEGWDLNLSWDLSDLVWNESQTSIDVRSKLMVQLRDDVVDEVTRIYFERRRLQIELLTDPPADLKTKLKKTLRLQELTADLDGLTGEGFSRAIKSQ